MYESRSRCPECPGTHPVVVGDGPTSCSVVFIGEAPGKDENKGGRPFVGKAGREFNEHYLRLAGLHRNGVYVTNTVKCFWASSGKAPPPELVKSCSRFHLKRELQNIQPEVIVAMGSTAVSLLPGLRVDMEHGIPRTAKVLGLEAKVFPIMHPASGMYDGKNITHLRNDFKTLRDVLNHTYIAITNDFPDQYNLELTSPVQVDSVLEPKIDIAIDTESVPTEDKKWKPWCLTFAQSEDRGYLIRDPATLQRFGWLLNTRHRKRIFMQNHLHDVMVMETMRIETPMRRLHDTMMRSYHLGGGLPQGLKAMAYRLLGVHMEDFDDVVNPYWQIYAEEYLRKVAKVDWPKEREQLIEDEKGLRLYRPQNLNTKIKRLFTDLRKLKSEEKLPDILKRFWSWPIAQQLRVVERFGYYPRPSVALVPFEDVLEYACRDAVVTWRLGQMLFERTVTL